MRANGRHVPLAATQDPEPTFHVIQELHISDFKAFGREQIVPLGKITLVFGANSSGKSSLLHAILFAHEVVRTGNADVRFTALSGNTVDLGGWNQFRFGQTAESQPSIRLVSSGYPGGNIRNVAPAMYHMRRTFHLRCHQGRFGPRVSVELGTPNHRDLGFEVYTDMVAEPYPSDVKVFRGGGVESILLSRLHELYTRAGAEEALSDDLALDLIAYLVPFSVAGEHRAPVVDHETGIQVNRDWYGLAPLVAPLHSPRAVRAMEAVHELYPDIDDMLSALFFAQNPEDAHDWGEEKWNSFTTRWEKRYERQLGSLEQLGNLVEELEYNKATVQPFIPELTSILSAFGSIGASMLQGCDYLGPLRSYPQRSGVAADETSANWTSQGESEWASLVSNKELRNKVNSWLSESKLDLGLHFEHVPLIAPEAIMKLMALPKEDQPKTIDDILSQVEAFSSTAVLADTMSGAKVTARDVGVGIAQLLPLVVRALSAKHGLHLVEQPELHLHPGLQARLADLYLFAANQSPGMLDNQFILETHSEHMILRFLRRIRETHEGRAPEGMALTPDDLSVIHVERRQGGARVTKIEVSEQGAFLTPWPQGFFPERLNELG